LDCGAMVNEMEGVDAMCSERSLVILLRSFVNFVTQGYKGTVGSSREFRNLMTKEV